MARSCDRSCPDCLRNYGNRFSHGLLDWRLALAYEAHGRRCLVLTYNSALAGDIKRLLVLLNVPSAYEGGGVEVRTAMSFVYAWLSKLGLHYEDGFENYEARCAEFLEMIEAGTISPADIQSVIDQDPETFGFDAIIVDEAQDWPQPEARLLAAIHGGERVSIADGREQLMRGKPTDWGKTLAVGQASDQLALARCLRMKRNLGLFANTVARLAGLNWEIEPNDEAAGGRVIILNGSYADDASLVGQLLAEAREAGNDEVDFLHCVPPSNVAEIKGERSSALASSLVRLGHATWDGVNDAVRRDFPRSTDVFRVLQYDSSRGLEGWTTVLEHFDEAWDYKRKSWLAQAIEKDADAPSDPARAARLAAWRWCMIALTRPMDTLVISLADPSSPASEIIKKAANVHSDFAEMRNT